MGTIIRWISIFLGMAMLLSSCASLKPEISKKERQELEKASPYSHDFGYSQALLQLREMILAKPTVPSGVIIQPKSITNTSVSSYGQGEDIPIDVTNIVITALSRLSSPKIKIVPYDPNFVTTANQITHTVASSHLQPNLILAGSITEFDKDIEVKGSDISLDVILDRGKPNTSMGGNAENSRKMSRVTIDLYLLSSTTQEVLPGTSISNTIKVVEIEKGRGFGFEIFGSGIEVEGTISASQGFHRAVRNLIGYSIVQLMGRAFELNYEPLLGITTQDQLIKQSSNDSQQSAPPPQEPSTVLPSSTMNMQIAIVRQHGAQPETVLDAGEELESGSRYRIIVKPEQDCYLYVFQKDSTNKLDTLFPNSGFQQSLNNPLKGGETYFFPGKEDYFFLDKQGGSEQIYFYSIAEPDRHLDNILSLYNQVEDSARKEPVEQMVTAYLATKHSVNTVKPGPELQLDKDGNNSVKMTSVQLINSNSIYVLPFIHR